MGKELDDAKKTGGRFKDKVISVTGSELARSIVKVTSHSSKPISDKHINRLIDASHDPTTSTWIVSELEKRLHSHEWIVVLKALLVLHKFLKSGLHTITEKICQQESLFHISHFKDLTKHSRFIKSYARYLEERCMSTLQIRCGLAIEKKDEMKQELERMPFSRAVQCTKVLIHCFFFFFFFFFFFETGSI